MSSIKKFSRDFSKDPDYSPSWRANQAFEYRRVHRELVTRGEENFVVIPKDENDKYVVDYFSLLVNGVCRYPEVKYAHSCFSTNHSRGFGTKIQAMFLGKKSIEEIAESFKTDEINIECYLKIFFDVIDYLDCETLIYSIIAPYDRWKETPQDVIASSIWMGLSYSFGWDSSKYILERRLNVTNEISSKLTAAMKNSLELQASEYVLGVRLVNHARPSDFDRHISYTNALSLSEQMRSGEDSVNGDLFRKALWDGIKEVSSSLSYDDPARELIGQKENELRNKGKKEIKQLEYFTPQPL
jgi:hypothetical protein